MHAMLSDALTGSVARLNGRLAEHRANLRSRTYRNAELGSPAIEPEVIAVRAADGSRLRVQAYGPADGRVVVLVHGWSCCAEFWNPQINAFASDYRVIAFDLRGHGESEFGSPAQLDCELLADDLSAVLAAVLPAGQRAVLVGHSLGAMTLQAWADRYSDQVAEQAAAVLLANTGPHELVAETTVVPGFNRVLPVIGRSVPLPVWLGRLGLGNSLALPPLPHVRRFFARLIMNSDADRELVDFCLNIVRSCPARIRGRFGILLAEMDLGDAARNLVVPTTVLAGSFDDMTPPVHAAQIAHWLTESGSLARFRTLPTGHMGPIEAMTEFNAELQRVLRSVDGSSRATG